MDFWEGSGSLKMSLRAKCIWYFPIPKNYFHLLWKLSEADHIYIINYCLYVFSTVFCTIKLQGPAQFLGRNVAFVRRVNFIVVWSQHEGQLPGVELPTESKAVKEASLMLTLPILSTIPVSLGHWFSTDPALLA